MSAGLQVGEVVIIGLTYSWNLLFVNPPVYIIFSKQKIGVFNILFSEISHKHVFC